MPCPITDCRSTIEATRLCPGHTRQTAAWLAAITDYHRAAHDCLLPVAGGEAGGPRRSGEIPLGVNITALSFINANDIYLILGGWERVIRSERHLTPAGLLPPVPGVNEEVWRLVEFHTAHLDWIAEQGWAPDYVEEVRGLYQMGMTAARVHAERHTRLRCPVEGSDGLPCGSPLTLDPDDPLAAFQCRVCGTQWTTLRLIAVALEDRTRPLWVAIEDAAALLGKSESQIRRVARKVHGQRRRGELVNLHALQDFYAA